MIDTQNNMVRSPGGLPSVFKTLSFKLIGGVVVILIIVHTLTGFLATRSVSKNTLHYTDSIGQAISQTVANSSIEPLLLRDYPVLETYANQLVDDNPLVVRVQYKRLDDVVLAVAQQAGAEVHTGDSKAIRQYKAPIEAVGDGEIVGYVTVDISTQNMSTLFRTHLVQLVAILTVSLVIIVFLLVFFLRYLIIMPVKKLAKYAYTLGAGDFDQTISIDTRDEIGQLARAFDEMKVNLKTSYSAIQEQNERLVSLDKMKSQFLANMSHEIRTPMNAIVGFSYLLADEDLSPEQKDEVDVIRESAQNLLNLINDILDFSKVEAGQLDIQMVDCSLGELLNSIESMMMAQAKEKSLDFQIIVDKDVPAQIHSDPFRLRQCLINLVSNALKFTPKGHVHMKLSLRQGGPDDAVRFDVEDSGIGIPEDRQAAVFESFTQVDGSTTREYGGTGLGLAVTKQLAGLLGGELLLTSETGQGSTFSLIIPTGLDIAGKAVLNRSLPMDQHIEDVPRSDDSLFSGSVLVAEDVAGNQKLMKSMLSKLGVEVTIVEDGIQAIAKALSETFDLILMDMQMPHMNGYDATAALKQQGCKTPIVALTANAMKGDDEKCREAGCDGYLAKPVDHEKLRMVVSQYLSGTSDVKAQPDHSEAVPAPEPEVSSTSPSFVPASSGESGFSELRDIIDWDQLIERLGDEETVKEIMPIYIEDTKMHFEKLSAAVEVGDCQRIASHAHALKGVGRNLSVNQLADLAAQMERAGRDNDPEASTLLMGSLSQEIEKVLRVLVACDWTDNTNPVG